MTRTQDGHRHRDSFDYFLWNQRRRIRQALRAAPDPPAVPYDKQFWDIERRGITVTGGLKHGHWAARPSAYDDDPSAL